MKIKSRSHSAKSGLVWSAVDRFGTQVLQLTVMLILAKKLGPEAYGLIGLVSILLALGQVFVDSGFSSALIRKIDRTESDYSTVFIFNGMTAIIYSGMLWLTAPLIADYFQRDELTNLISVLSLVVPINSIAIVQRIKLSVILDFKTQAKASISAALLGGAAGIIAAYFFGLGVWAIAIQILTAAVINSALLNILNPWLPVATFNSKSFRSLFGFSWKLLLSALIESIYSNLYPLVIGKSYNISQVGFYTQANQLSSVPAMTLTNVLQRVTYPVLSKIQNDILRFEKAYFDIIKLSSSVVFPVMTLVGILSPPFLTNYIGEKWAPAGLLITILSIGFMLYPLHAINLNLLQVKGRSDLFLKVELIKKTINTIVLLITLPYGILSICIGIAITSYTSLIVNLYYTSKLTSITKLHQLKAIFPIWMICSCFIITAVITQANKNLMQSIIIALFFLFIYSSYIYFYQKDIVVRIKYFLQKDS